MIPELKPGTQAGFLIGGEPNLRCRGDACYTLHMQNWPDGVVAKLEAKLGDHCHGLFDGVHWLGHRYFLFAAYVEIRSGIVSRYEYSLEIEYREYPVADTVGMQVFGSDRASFPGYFGFMRFYDEIGDFRTEVASNKPTTSLYVSFTPDAQPSDVRSAFEVHLNCLWNAQQCSATKQLLPSLWEKRIKPRSYK